MNQGIASALVAAVLFGASTPFAKRLVGEMPPLMLAGLLYLGSGLGLSAVVAWRALFAHRQIAIAWPVGVAWGWLGCAILFGGILGPVLLLNGLTSTSAATASLLLNSESALTALVAWFAFGEHFDRRIALGMALIVSGGLLLSWIPDAGTVAAGSMLVIAACACWAIDNNLTRKVSASDAMITAGIKGIVAGSVSLAIALQLGQTLPSFGNIVAAAVLGFLSYGISLTLFVLALRHLGAARAGAYFAVAPFVGAVIAIALGDDVATPNLIISGALMALGIYLHVTERHDHPHVHAASMHEHVHRHDEHHAHRHEFAWDGTEPHSHPHVHEALVHRHHHFPDIHHRH